MLGQAEGDELADLDVPPPRPTEAIPDQIGFTPQPAVRWFDPDVLVRTGMHVGVTTVFGSFLDKRELQSTVPAQVDTSLADHRAGVWLDYVADTGDGFDATYAVASTVAARDLTVAGHPTPLPRGHALVLGGDQVYPAASAENYEDRLAGPMRAALPWTDRDHPALFAIPGNHDWYDGLTGFLRLFGQERWIGGWRTRQSRSYFAMQLPHRWWLWGVDIQFDMFIDAPQLAYFESVADSMRRGDRLVLATATPSWVDLEHDPDAHRNLAYLERKLLRPRGIDLKLTLAGDRHHYSRFTDSQATHKITSGGGGAFLHPTHDLPREVTIPVDPAAPDGSSTFRAEALYPERGHSRRLAFTSLLLPLRNPKFMWVPALMHLLLLWTNQFGIRSLDPAPGSYTSSAEGSGWSDLAAGLVRNPGALALLAALGAGLIVFARPPAGLHGRMRAVTRMAMGTVHTAAQVAVVVAVAMVAFRLATPLGDGPPFVVAASVAVAALGGVAGSVTVGAYLAAATLMPRWSTHGNEAFSAARLERCKNFVRMNVTADGDLDLYAIAIDRPAKAWRTNADSDDREAPWLLPVGSGGIAPHLIEKVTLR